ncbi:unnamed protein product [marine sediment metagenome]|uniref:Uncharacterized protein n=1 Tax=marine sediment metagenome TaxID=412755 RepID=X0SSA0_9ZZZZ
MKTKKIKILNKLTTIKILNKVAGDKLILGQWKPLDREIQLKKAQAAINETLLHELLEAIKDDCDLNMSHQTLSTLSATLGPILKQLGWKGI